jgi:NAD(P)H-flavin reductase
VSLIGDTHPVFHGSVVKAIASGMRTYPKILSVLKDKLDQRGDDQEYLAFAEQMNHLFNAKVHSITRKTTDVVEITIHAPLAAKHFQPGQFYRLQNFETFAPRIDHTLLQMEPLALVTAECDAQQGMLTFIVTENTATAKLCATLQPGEPVSLMGPTGVRAKIPTEHETVLIIGDISSFAFVRSYGTALREAGNHVIFVCQFSEDKEIYCRDLLENAADIIIWQQKNKGDSIDAVDALLIHQQDIPLADVDRIFIVGNTDLLRHFKSVRKTTLKEYLMKDPKVYASVYGNMQCMLKGVCAQCLQWQIDPETGQRTKAVFACSWQDQPLELIDINHIDERLTQNHVLDQVSQWWVDHIFSTYDFARI